MAGRSWAGVLSRLSRHDSQPEKLTVGRTGNADDELGDSIELWCMLRRSLHSEHWLFNVICCCLPEGQYDLYLLQGCPGQ
jgi:hypothetical protein